MSRGPRRLRDGSAPPITTIVLSEIVWLTLNPHPTYLDQRRDVGGGLVAQREQTLLGLPQVRVALVQGRIKVSLGSIHHHLRSDRDEINISNC